MKVLLVQLGFIGDVILSTAVITRLREIFPSAEIDVLTTPLSAELVRHHPKISQCLTYDKRKTESGVIGLLRVARRLRSEKYDAVFSLHKSWRTAILLAVTGIPERYGFSEAAGAFLYHKTSSRNDLFHEVQRNLAVLRVLGDEPGWDSPRLHIGLPQAVLEQADKLWGDVEWSKRIVFAPGSVWETKRWSPERFAELAELMIRDGYVVGLVGGPQDKEVGLALQKSCPAVAQNWIGQTSLLEAAALIASSQLLVSNDSAPLHIGSAVDTPTVGVFCATIPEFGFGPWRNLHRNIGLYELPCRPCARHGGRRCPLGTAACMTDLPAGAVYAAAQDLLQDVAAVRESR